MNKHRLVTLGDSLTQGFSNGAIFDPRNGYPAFLAQALGNTRFDLPNFLSQGGIPLNMEAVIRGLEDEMGRYLDWDSFSEAAYYIFKTANRVKRHWEGKIKDLSDPHQLTPYHNQSVWGSEICDTWVMNERKCWQYMQDHAPSLTALGLFPDHAMYVTARRVLNPSFTEKFANASMLDNVEWFSENGGIENLCVWIGANNCIGALTSLDIIYSLEHESELMPTERTATVFHPEHFERDLVKMAERISRMNIDNVFMATLPQPTLAPITRGINSDLSSSSGYFDYYTFYWMWDSEFDPTKHKHLTKGQAIELDLLMDEYNRIIRKTADKYGFHIVPLGRFINKIAHRTQMNMHNNPFPDTLVSALKKNPATSYLVDENDDAQLDARYLRLNKEGKLIQGGIFSLDGLHPTTLGYGLIAHGFQQTMMRAGVHFENDLDWDSIIKNDTLISNPPYLLSELKVILRVVSIGIMDTLSRMGYSYYRQLKRQILAMYGN